MVVLPSFFGFRLSPETWAQIISALATTLAVIVILGLRLIDDELNRYEKFARPIIETLLKTVDEPIKTGLSQLLMDTLSFYNQKLVESSSVLRKHGQFFLTKLYPQKSLNKIDNVSKDIDKFLKTLEEFKTSWNDPNYLKLLFEGIELKKEISKEGQDEQKKKSESLRQARKLRETMLKEIDEIIKELHDFLEKN
jgi:hypothetical protein